MKNAGLSKFIIDGVKKVFEESPFLNNFIPSELTDGVYYYRAFNDSGDRELKGYFNLYK